MFIITTFNPLTTVGGKGTFNTTFPGGRGKMVIRNHTYVTLVVSVNGFASLSSNIPPGASHTFEISGAYSTIYWSTLTNEVLNSPTLDFHRRGAQVIAEGYDLGEEVPDDTSFQPRFLQSGYLASTTNDWVFSANSSLSGTANHSTTLGPFNVTYGMWLVRVSVRFGIPTANIAMDDVLQDINGAGIEFYHINTGTTDPYIIDDTWNPPFPVTINANGQASVSYVHTGVVSAPGYSVNIYAFVQ